MIIDLLTYHSVQDIMNMILRLSMDFGFENFHIIPPDKPGTEKDVLQRRQKAVSASCQGRYCYAKQTIVPPDVNFAVEISLAFR